VVPVEHIESEDQIDRVMDFMFFEFPPEDEEDDEFVRWADRHFRMCQRCLDTVGQELVLTLKVMGSLNAAAVSEGFVPRREARVVASEITLRVHRWMAKYHNRMD